MNLKGWQIIAGERHVPVHQEGAKVSGTCMHVRALQDGEQEKQKSYLARCRLPCAVTPELLARINGTRDLLLQQTTPARVEHRRAMLVSGGPLKPHLAPLPGV